MTFEKKNLLILYDYFYPGYKAGGPIQSLTNLAVTLNKQYRIFVVTGSRDLTSTETYNGIAINQWNEVFLQGSENLIQVYYADEKPDKKKYDELFNEVTPDIFYFNNIYSYHFFHLPLSALKKRTGKYKVVTCPRGMLQQGALGVKPFKKKIYLNYLRFLGSLDNAYWHATNEEEARDIKKHFPKNKSIVIAPNIPKPPVEEIFYPKKSAGELRLVFLSLIAEKKNLLLLIEVMQTLKKDVSLDIYGPITDETYWAQCSKLLQQMPGTIKYKGEVEPGDVQTVLSQYHALILLTKGENFGHALYESLSAGRPVITSYFTSWNDLQQKKAGMNLNINDRNECIKKLHEFAGFNQDKYNIHCKNAHELAMQYYTNLDTKNSYKNLFG